MTLDELKQNIGDPTSDDGFNVLQDEVESEIQAGYMADQIDLANYIAQSLVGVSTQLATQNPKRYDDLQKYFTLLSFSAFPACQPQEKINLLQKRLLYAVQKGLDTDEFLKQFYALYENLEFIQTLFRSYAKYMEDNSEQFGSQPIEVDGRRLLPQVKYWLLDYAKFPSRVAKRGPVERLNYANQSPNTKALPQGQREILLRILKLYDEFLNPDIPMSHGQSAYDLGSSNSDGLAGKASSIIDMPYADRAPDEPENTTPIPRQIQAEPGSWQSSVEFGPMPQQSPQSTSHQHDDSALIRDKLDKLHERTGK